MPPVDDTTLGLLAAVFGVSEPGFSQRPGVVHLAQVDTAAVNVLADRLEEIGRLDLKWVLLGRCVRCGGEMRKQRPKGDAVYRSLLGEPYLKCRACKEEDVDAINAKKEWSQTRINRVVRLLGLKRCATAKHVRDPKRTGVWFAAADCPKCGGLGIIRP